MLFDIHVSYINIRNRLAYMMDKPYVDIKFMYNYHLNLANKNQWNSCIFILTLALNTVYFCGNIGTTWPHVSIMRLIFWDIDNTSIIKIASFQIKFSKTNSYFHASKKHLPLIHNHIFLKCKICRYEEQIEYNIIWLV